MTNTEKVCEFTAAIRGYHYYRQLWNPQVSKVLQCVHDFGNVFDIFAIKTLNNKGEIVGHLPREISRVSKLLLDRGATIQATLTTTNYRRSPLVQGGLEIACKVTARMAGTVRNHMLLERYMKLVTELYADPKEEVILGSFLVKACETSAQPTSIKKKKSKDSTEPSKKPRRDRDIRTNFLNAATKTSATRDRNEPAKNEKPAEKISIILDD